jgi:Zn-dependent metalloprotease
MEAAVSCTAPVCFIVPPDLLFKVAMEGTPEQREGAIGTLTLSAAVRARRSLISRLMTDLDQDVQALTVTPPQTGEQLSVYDVHGGREPDLPGDLARQSGGAVAGDDAVNQAYDGADATYRFYKEVFDRDSIDGNGMEVVSSVHFARKFGNAFWDQALGQMVYGDGGDGLIAVGTLTAAIDVIGHEITHGVTGHTAKLEYSFQSGALNESISDVFGSLIKQRSLGQTAEEADWLIGQGIMEPGHGNALRSMSDPGHARPGDMQPADMAHLWKPDPNGPIFDAGGVHINSGIPNRAFYLAAMAIGGNAWEKAGRIWYVTLTDRLRPKSQFEDAAKATVEVAGSLFPGGPEQEAVHEAWHTVGVLA